MHPDLTTLIFGNMPDGVHVVRAWVEFLPAIIAAISALANRGGSNSGSSPTPGVTTETTDTNLTALMRIARERMDMQTPLFQAVQRLAMGLMPTAYQQGMSPFGSSNGGGENGENYGPTRWPNTPPNWESASPSNTPWGRTQTFPGGADTPLGTPESLRRLPRQSPYGEW